MKEFFKKIGNFFKKCYQSCKAFVLKVAKKIANAKITSLVMMQLKDKWNLSFKTNKKLALLKISGRLIVFAVITVIAYFLMDMTTSTLHIFFGDRIPLSAMKPILFLLMVFEVVSILIGMTRSLYFAKDNTVLITYPVKPDYLFLSKVIVYYVDAVKKSLMLFFPVIISFGIIYKYSIPFYLWALFFDLILVALITLICGLLSVPTYYVLKFLDKFKVAKVIFSVALTGALIALTIFVYKLIPENINLIREYDKFTRGLNNFLANFSKDFAISSFITHAFLGVRSGYGMKVFSDYTWQGVLFGLVGIALFVLANALLAKPFYLKMIATSNRSSNKPGREHKNHKSSKGFSVFKYELFRIIRDEKHLVSSIICVVSLPLIILLVNKFYVAFNSSGTGAYFMFIFNFFFISIVAFSHNTSSSYIYSKDGPSWSVNKTMPVNPRLSLSLRLVYNLAVSLLIIIPSSIIFFNNSKVTDRYSLLLFIITIFVLATFHNFLSASYDYSNSPNKDKADIGSEIVSSHELVSVAFGFLTALGALLLLFLMLTSATKNPQIRLLIVSLIACFGAIFSFLRKVKATYQEN